MSDTRTNRSLNKKGLPVYLVDLFYWRPLQDSNLYTSEINDRWWTIPAERSKNKRSHRVYLTDSALDLIGPLKVAVSETSELKLKGAIFPSPRINKTANGMPMPAKAIEVNAIAHVIRKNYAVPVKIKGKQVFDDKGKPITENKLGVEFFTPHDLRRTAATFMSGIGFHDEVIDAVLNHTKQSIIRTYNLNRYDAEKQQALEAWERKLLSIITGIKGNVISIEEGKKKAA